MRRAFWNASYTPVRTLFSISLTYWPTHRNQGDIAKRYARYCSVSGSVESHGRVTKSVIDGYVLEGDGGARGFAVGTEFSWKYCRCCRQVVLEESIASSPQDRLVVVSVTAQVPESRRLMELDGMRGGTAAGRGCSSKAFRGDQSLKTNKSGPLSQPCTTPLRLIPQYTN